MGTLYNAVMAVALLLLAWGFAQFVLWYRWGTAELESALGRPPAPQHPYPLLFLAAGPNEEAVIGDRATPIPELAPDATVVVADDASADQTRKLATGAGAM